MTRCAVRTYGPDLMRVPAVTMKSTVTWATGGTEITLQGATTVQEDCEWTQNENDWAHSTTSMQYVSLSSSC